uniref:Fas (tnfrsf6)-associated via death domain n=1 Tax=Tetraodon nigroviridis TaxID=99883 RepID=H3BYG2_TETNG
MESLKFKAVLLEISDQLSEDQLENLKYLCQDEIGKRRMEKIDSGTKLFVVLKERGKLGEDSTEFLGQLLSEIHRDDLVEKLNAFVNGFAPRHQDHFENAKLDIAKEVIAENLGTRWRRLARKLGLSEVKLESISKRHPSELYETAVEMLKEWRKMRGPEADVADLIKALRACDFNMTADILESRLSVYAGG